MPSSSSSSVLLSRDRATSGSIRFFYIQLSRASYRAIVHATIPFVPPSLPRGACDFAMTRFASNDDAGRCRFVGGTSRPSNGRSDARFGVAFDDGTMRDFFSIRPSREVPAFRRRPPVGTARRANNDTEVSTRHRGSGHGRTGARGASASAR